MRRALRDAGRLFCKNSQKKRRAKSTDTSSPSESGLFQSIRPITRAGAVRGAMAGFQLAAMNIPQVLGYTRIAGTPIATGFYTLLLPLVGFAAFGSSRY